MSWERRKHKRISTVVPVLISGELFHAKGHTADLSKGGCVIASAHAPEKGQHLHLLLQVPKLDTSINIQLAVVRWSSFGLFGVEFIRISTRHQEKLHHYLYMLDLSPSLGTLVHSEGSAEETQSQQHDMELGRLGNYPTPTPTRAGKARQQDLEFSRLEESQAQEAST